MACPNCLYISGKRMGHSTACSSRLISSRPPLTPRNIWHPINFSHSRWGYFLYSILKIAHSYDEFSRVSGGIFSSSKLASESFSGIPLQLFTQIFKISTYKPMSYCSAFVLIYISIQWLITCMYLQYL